MKVFISFIDKNFKSKIKMENNGTIPIVGKGSIMVYTKKGEKKEIQNIYFSLDMKHNLMSVRQITQILKSVLHLLSMYVHKYISNKLLGAWLKSQDPSKFLHLRYENLGFAGLNFL